ncbi:Pyridoxal-5'-phosphate-dependent protein beta subunit [Methanosalsum zhilinae DSM 4017]|uniref:Cysteate synthase n=1 Tax=Methanosalsum zhilinae (strain DSM 4017 / NBRC 107636 / OCM 62 / WeN5) TaxID=679901 RepID=F7XKN4_METZD|nr:Pyridoxal-5'-phosphate-dependent protein beta subunit [Methanosalsum zhilinae DSM 4017]
MTSNNLLKCLECGTRYDNDFRLSCDNDDSFLRMEYPERINLRQVNGIGKFTDWLPINEVLTTTAGPVTYKSEHLAEELGLTNLYISFSGYWPERDASIKTCSFKELEAHPTMQRLKESGHKAIVLASVGNTARAFAYVSALTGMDVYIVVPEFGLDKLWIPTEVTDSIHLITMNKGNDYTDAINLSQRIADLEGIMPEGGARNVARRDGMATVMLDAAFTINRIPDHYFQAVGSGTGAIAAWEASIRLRNDGRFSDHMPKLQLAQNLPFTPMVNAWNERRREIIPELDMPDAKSSIEKIYADVLSNRTPAYSVTGGLFDCLTESDGIMYAISNSEAKSAQDMFESLEGVDILPPSAVAVASLVKAVEKQNVNRDDVILLNIAGGGEKILKSEFSVSTIKPTASAKDSDIDLDLIMDTGSYRA